MPSLQIVPGRVARPDQAIEAPAPHLAEREPVATGKNPPSPEIGAQGASPLFLTGFFPLTRLNTLVLRGAGVSRGRFGVRAAVCADVEV